MPNDAIACDHPTPGSTRRFRRRTLTAVAAAGLLAACSSGGSPASSPTTPTTPTEPTETTHDRHPPGEPTMRSADRAAAQLATAAFQDVDAAEAAGYATTLETLGCFQEPTIGGMGVHYLDDALMDATVDIAHPEALVYELANDGSITGLVAHEYIVPVDAWTSTQPPTLFGVELHRHPTLPLWVLHTWIWKDNIIGVFADWNPAVRQCPAGVPIFGIDLPA